MNISLCTNFISFDSLFSCFYDKAAKPTKYSDEGSIYTLSLDKRITSYEYELDTDQTRTSIFDMACIYINNPVLSTSLPHIFKTTNIKGCHLMQVIHEEIAPFYNSIVMTTTKDKAEMKIHIVLNSMHILITCYPIYDNKNKVIGCTLLEIPFTQSPSMHAIQASSKNNCNDTRD
jgi:hypothetical protein